MAAKVTTFVRHLLSDALLKQLKTITKANGYNTQPAVSDDWQDIDSSDAQFILHLVVGDEEILEQSPQLDFKFALTFSIDGNAYVKNGGVNETRDMLLQDVRACLVGPDSADSNWIADIQDSVVKCVFSFDTCVADGGLLLGDDQVGFSQDIVFAYWQRASKL